MPARFRLAVCLLGLLLLAAGANAQNQLTYYVSGTFSDGGTFSGSFNYDSLSNTYSNVYITTTPGTVRTTGAIYKYVCGQDVANCTGLSPNAGRYLNLTTTMADQTGNPAMALFVAEALNNFGQGDFGVGQGSPTTDVAALEANCGDAHCGGPTGPSRTTDVGSSIISSSPTEFLFFFFS